MISFIQHFETELAHLPANIKTIVEPQFRQYCEQFDRSALLFPDDPKFIPSVVKVWCCSPFVAKQCLRYPEMFNNLVISKDLFTTKDEQYYRDSLTAISATNEAELMVALRTIRSREMVRKIGRASCRERV